MVTHSSPRQLKQIRHLYETENKAVGTVSIEMNMSYAVIWDTLKNLGIVRKQGVSRKRYKENLDRLIGLAGVYYMRNLDNSKCYVGSSVNVERRLKQHLTKLDKGKHLNTSLQKDFDKTRSHLQFGIIAISCPGDSQAAESVEHSIIQLNKGLLYNADTISVDKFSYLSPQDISRFWSKINKLRNGCWEFPLPNHAKDTDRYPQFSWRGSPKRHVSAASRVSYWIKHKGLPNGLLVCHTCDNKSCVNPAHLFIGSNLENMADKEAKGLGVKPRVDYDKIIDMLRDGSSVKDICKAADCSTATVYRVHKDNGLNILVITGRPKGTMLTNALHTIQKIKDLTSKNPYSIYKVNDLVSLLDKTEEIVRKHVLLITGVTTGRYLYRLRYDNIVHEILTTTCTFNEVAKRFNVNRKEMSKRVKKHTGLTPTQLRRF